MRARAPILLALAAALAGCDDLPPAQAGVCGNQVVDPGEDCDTFALGEGTSCRPPGSAGQCRYACGAGDAPPRCPAGMGCGVDGTCRQATGSFAAGTQPVAGDFSEILAGDVDGDRRADVVGVGANAVTVSWFDAALALTATFQTPRGGVSLAHPLLSDLSGDGRADLLVAVAAGTLVDLGSGDRTLIPTACPSIAAPGFTNVRIIVVEALPDVPGKEVIAMGTLNGASGLAVLESSGQGTLFGGLTQPPSALAGDAVVGNLDEDPVLSPCDEFAFAYTGAGEVIVYTSCKPDGMGGWAYNAGSTPWSVALAGGATMVRGPLLLDVNHDGHLDFLVGASSCSGCEEVQVAYGVGDGTFHSDPATIPKSAGDDTFSKYPLVTGPLPLAMGDLNGDGVPDQVTPTSVRMSAIGPGSTITFADRAVASLGPWTEAVIADLNRDGIPDVLAGSSSTPGVEFFGGAGDAAGSLAPFQIHTHGPVAHFTVGDFDGDMVNDVALAEIAPAADPLGDSVSILFGQPVGAPDPPVGMGRFVDIEQVVQGHFLVKGDGTQFALGRNDLLTVSAPDSGDTFFGAFRGSGDRVLRSPFGMAHATMGAMVSASVPWRYALGSFTKPGGPIEIGAIDMQFYPPPTTPVHQLWLIPTDGKGRFLSPQARSSDPLPDGLDWSLAALGAVDLDGSGVQQLVALGPSTADAIHGAFAVARAVVPAGGMPGDPQQLLMGAPAAIDARVSHAETDTPAAQTGRLLVADADGDGSLDVIVLATVADPPGAAPSPHVVVLWNDHEGTLGPMTVVPNPAGQVAVDFAVMDNHGPAPDLAVLTGAGVSLARFAGRAPPAPGPVVVPVAGGLMVAAGDVDGDGVLDLVVADAAGFVVYAGKAVRP